MNFFRGMEVELRNLTEKDCQILFLEQKDSTSVRLFETGIENIETQDFLLS